jgi:Polysaccharide pyruvyl transferase
MTKKQRILIAWWGSFPGGGPTVGDWMSLQNVVKVVEECGFVADIASIEKQDNLSFNYVNWYNVNPKMYDTLLFVCGPIIKGSVAFQKLIERFFHCRKIAIGVSILPGFSLDYWDPFDIVLARDGTNDIHFDVALANPPITYTTPRSINNKLTIGVCLRGKQREYGSSVCLNELAIDIVDYILTQVPHHRLDLETRLDRTNNKPETIDALFSTPDVIITTRLHGALLGIRHGVPVLALDQIDDGAKVRDVLNWLGWKYVFPVKHINLSNIFDIFQQLLTEETQQHLMQIRLRAVKEANKTLDTLKVKLLN